MARIPDGELERLKGQVSLVRLVDNNKLAATAARPYLPR